VTDQFCSANISNQSRVINPNPTIVPTNTTVCFGTTAVNITYTATESPDQYTLTTGTRAVPGFVPVAANSTLGSSPLVVTIPANTPAGTYDFNVQVTNSTTGCQSTVATFTITVIAPPLVTASVNAPASCPGNPVTLTAGPTLSSYSWTVKNNPTVIATTASTVVSPTTTTTYEVTGTDANGCSAKAEVTVTVSVPPTLTVTPSNPTICQGASTLLAVSGGTIYSWSPATGLSSTVGSSVIASPTTTTTYTVSSANETGCVGTQTVIVTVTDPAIAVNASTTSLCAGAIATLTGSGGTAYQWYPATSLYSDPAATTLINPSTSYTTVYAKPTSTTTYQMLGTSGSCSKLVSQTITVTPSPINTALSTANEFIFCSNRTTSLPITVATNSASTFSFEYSTTAFGSTPVYTSFATTTSAGTTQIVPSTTSTSATATISWGNTNVTYIRFTIVNGGCTTQYVVRINDTRLGFTFAAPLTAQTTICSGTTASMSIGTFASTYAYQWQVSTTSPTSGFANVTGGTGGTTNAYTTPTLTPPTTPATYYYRLELDGNAGNCKAFSDPRAITVVAAAGANTISLTGNCTDGTAVKTITGNAVTGATYQWESSTTSSSAGFTAIIGATSQNYTIPNNLVSTTTWYRRVATVTSCGDVTSAAVVAYAPVTNNSISTSINSYCGTAPSILLTGTTPIGGDGVYTYQWYSSTNGSSFTIISGATSINYTTSSSSQTTYYKRTVSSGGGCSNADAVIVITVKSNPTVAVTPTSAAVCSGISTVLTASGAASYTWSPSTGLSATTGDVVTATPSSGATTYTVTGTASNGCTGTATTTITVTASPSTPTLTSAAITVCSGTSVDLNSYISSGGTNEWYSVPEAKPAYLVTTPLTLSTAGTYSYYVFAKDGTCYSGTSATLTVTVNDVSKPTPQSANLSNCTAVDLTALQPADRTGIDYRWTTNTSQPYTLVANPANVTTSGTYYLVAYSTAGNCYGPVSDPVTATIIGNVPGSVNPTSLSTCTPNTVDLTASNTTSGGASTTYTWYTQNTPDPTKVVPDPRNVATSGTYYLIPYTSGCIGPVSSAVTVTISEKAVVTLTNPDVICNTSSPVSIVSTISNTVSNPTYKWQTSTDGINWTDVSNTGVYSGATSSTLGIANTTGLDRVQYRVIVTSASGSCTGTSDVTTLTVEPTITFSQQPVNVLRTPGVDATFSVTVPTDAVFSYQWQVSTDNGTNYTDLTDTTAYKGIETNTLTVVAPTIAMTGYKYRVKITNYCGETFSDAGILTVSSGLSLLVTNPAAVCAPNTVDLTAPAVTAGSTNISGATLTYWSDATANTSPIANPSAISVSGTYYIKATSGTESDIKPVVVTINPKPVLFINNPSPVCSPATINLTDAAVTSGTSFLGGSLTYWIDAAATTALLNPQTITASGTYYIKLLTPAGCFDIQPVSVVVNQPPTVGSISGLSSICSGSTAQLTVNNASAPGIWASSNTGVATVDASGLVTSVSPGSTIITYTVAGTGACSNAVASRPLTVVADLDL
jgi:hypothetical protein